MAKDVLIVKCNKDIPFEEWESVVNYIKLQVENEYYIVGTLKGMDIECVTDKARVFNIDGDNYSYQAIKEAIETAKQEKTDEKIEEKIEENIEETSTEVTEENKEVEENVE